MRIARVHSAQPSVIGGDIVTIETDLSRGLYSFAVVGLAGKAVEEARDRISSAIKNSGFKSPKSSNHKIVISLAPADLKKEGPLFDLPMAIAYLIAAKDINTEASQSIFLGELALDGTLRPVRGVLPAVRKAAEAGFTEAIVPLENAREAALVSGVRVLPARSLLEVVQHLDHGREDHRSLSIQPPTTIETSPDEAAVHFEDVRGQEDAKRALTIAAAGRHNVLMVGPPGTGKTMLARAFQSILPPLSEAEALEVTAIHSVAGTLTKDVVSAPPFRAPHHTASHTSLVGGGTHPKPGEVTLAHRGVLFMDEFPEFERRSIDALRQPLEDRMVSIARVQGSALFPADFILVAAMNPHRGGNEEGDLSEQLLDSYRTKISGPIMDRIDLWIEVPHISYDALAQKRTQNGHAETVAIRDLVLRARARSLTRLSAADSRASANAEMSARDIEKTITLHADVEQLLKESALKLKLSPRAYHRTIKVARSIADLEGSDDISISHILEALQYRPRV